MCTSQLAVIHDAETGDFVTDRDVCNVHLGELLSSAQPYELCFVHILSLIGLMTSNHINTINWWLAGCEKGMHQRRSR